MSSSPSFHNPSAVLKPWQRQLYRLLLVPLGLIAANAIYLVGFTRDTAFFYAMLLLHLVLGVMLAIPFFVFATTHAKKMIHMWNKRAKYAVHDGTQAKLAECAAYFDEIGGDQ